MRNIKAFIAIVVLVAAVFVAASAYAGPDDLRYGDREFVVNGDALIPTSYVKESGWYRVTGEASNLPPATWDKPAIIDRLWLYNDGAIEKIGSEAELLAKFRECTDYNNHANLVSRIWVHYRDTYRYAPYLSSVEEMPTLPSPGDEASSLSWQWFQNPDFPAHADRDQVGADLVSFVRDGGGNNATRPAEPDPESFAHVNVTSSCKTYAHESGGHMLGMDHNVEAEVFDSATDPHPFARGLHACELSSKLGHSTIMVASPVTPCGPEYTTKPVPVFSSNGLKLEGVPLGTPMADNARMANMLAPYIARYRPTAQFKTSQAATTNCSSGPEHQCLAGDRFRVSITWGTPDGNVGAGQMVELRDSPGAGFAYATFFDPNNIEMVVKVLDACVEPFNRFWVFAGGLTNVETFLKVEDTLTGDIKIYHNPQDRPFQPIQDTDAFLCN